MISAGISTRDAPSWHLQPSLRLKTWSFTFVVVLLWLQNGFPSSSKSQWKNKERKVSVPCPCYPKRKRVHMLVSFLLTLLSERGGGTPPLLALRETRRGQLYRIKGVCEGMQSRGLDFWERRTSQICCWWGHCYARSLCRALRHLEKHYCASRQDKNLHGWWCSPLNMSSNHPTSTRRNLGMSPGRRTLG